MVRSGWVGYGSRGVASLLGLKKDQFSLILCGSSQFIDLSVSRLYSCDFVIEKVQA